MVILTGGLSTLRWHTFYYNWLYPVVSCIKVRDFECYFLPEVLEVNINV